MTPSPSPTYEDMMNVNEVISTTFRIASDAFVQFTPGSSQVFRTKEVSTLEIPHAEDQTMEESLSETEKEIEDHLDDDQPEEVPSGTSVDDNTEQQQAKPTQESQAIDAADAEIPKEASAEEIPKIDAKEVQPDFMDQEAQATEDDSTNTTVPINEVSMTEENTADIDGVMQEKEKENAPLKTVEHAPVDATMAETRVASTSTEADPLPSKQHTTDASTSALVITSLEETSEEPVIQFNEESYKEVILFMQKGNNCLEHEVKEKTEIAAQSPRLSNASHADPSGDHTQSDDQTH